jgi:hypothetical protein
MIKHNTVATKAINNSQDFGIDLVQLVAYLNKTDSISLTTWINTVGHPACDLTREQAREFANKLLELTEHTYTEPEQIYLSAYTQDSFNKKDNANV